MESRTNIYIRLLHFLIEAECRVIPAQARQKRTNQHMPKTTLIYSKSSLRAKRGNPESQRDQRSLDCFAMLAMTEVELISVYLMINVLADAWPCGQHFAALACISGTMDRVKNADKSAFTQAQPLFSEQVSGKI